MQNSCNYVGSTELVCSIKKGNAPAIFIFLNDISKILRGSLRVAQVSCHSVQKSSERDPDTSDTWHELFKPNTNAVNVFKTQFLTSILSLLQYGWPNKITKFQIVSWLKFLLLTY